MSTTAPPPLAPGQQPPPEQGPRGRFFSFFAPERGGAITSIITTILAFLLGGVVVAATGHNPISTYKGIFDGTGLNWFFPWVDGIDRENAAFNLQQTLIITTTLIFTSLAVAFAFRCGLFNIGGQGQWTVGAIVSVWIGSEWAGMFGAAHIAIAIVAAALAGAVWAGIAGLLKATVGAHEVITTIMLNWIAIYVGSYLFGLGGPLQNDANASVPISNDVVEGARLPIIWGDPILQGLHAGLILALLGLIAYWVILSRTTLGFRVRAVGRNPEAARYGGISVARSYFLAMAISGAFAGLGGAMDMLGWQFRLGTLDVIDANLGFIGIAVALLGRNTAVGVLFASLLFGALLYGTSTRTLDPTVFDPALAGNLAIMIQALVLLFIGADVLIIYLWRRRGLPMPRMPRMPRRRRRPAPAVAGLVADEDVAEPAAPPLAARARDWALARVPARDRMIAIGALLLGLVAFVVAVPPFTVRQMAVPIVLAVVAAAIAAWSIVRGERRLGGIALGIALIGGTLGALATESSVANLDRVFVWSALAAATLRFATPLLFAALGGLFSERSGVVNIGLEGMLLMGAFFGVLGADKMGSWVWGVVLAAIAGGVLAAIHGVISISLRADQILSGTAVWFLALGLTGYLFVDIYGPEGTPGDIPTIPDVHLAFLDGVPFFGDAFGDLNLLIWVGLALVVITYVAVFRTPFGLRLRSVGEHPRAAETVGLSVYGIRYTAVILSGVLGGLGGAFLSIGFVDSFSQNMTAGTGFIALAALIFGNWRPRGVLFACLLFGASSAIAQRLPAYSESAAILFETVPYILTIIAVAGLVGRPRPPAAVGIPYERS